MRLHFTVGCCDWRRTPGNPASLQLRRIEVLSACFVHRRHGVHHKLSLLRFNFGWWREAPLFRRREECSFVFLLWLQDFLCQPPRYFVTPVFMPLRLFLRPILMFRSVGARWWQSPWQFFSSDRFQSRTFLALLLTAVEIWHIGLVSSRLSSSVNSRMIWAAPRPEIQHKFFVSLNGATALLSPLLLNLFARLFLNPAVRECALILDFAAFRKCVPRTLWVMPLFTKRIRASTFQMVPA